MEQEPRDERPAGGVEHRRPAGTPDRPIETWTHDELETLVTGLPPRPDPRVHAANRIIGVADELGRVVMAAVGGAALLIVLALLVTPWLWIPAGVWVAWFAATIVWMIVRRRRVAVARPLGLEPPPR